MQISKIDQERLSKIDLSRSPEVNMSKKVIKTDNELKLKMAARRAQKKEE